MVFRYKKSSSLKVTITFILGTVVLLSLMIIPAIFATAVINSTTNTIDNPLLNELNSDHNQDLNDINGTEIVLSPDNSAFKNAKIFTRFEYPNGTIFGVGENVQGYSIIFISEGGDYWSFYEPGELVIPAKFEDFIGDSFSTFFGEFPAYIGLIIILMVVGSTTLGLFFAKINPYQRLGTTFNLWFFKRSQGKIGRLLNRTGLFDFGSEDQWYLEKHIVYKLDFYNWKTIFKELYVERWKDIWFLPAAIVIFLLSALGIGGFDDVMNYFIVVFLLAILVGAILAFYYPAVWIFSDVGLKTFKTSDEGDIASVKNLGSIIRNGVEIFFGFTTLFSIGGFSADFMGLRLITLEDFIYLRNIRTIPIPIILLNVFNQVLSMIVTFVLITIFIVPAVAMIAFTHFQLNHINIMTNTRKELMKVQEMVSGTLVSNLQHEITEDIVEIIDVAQT